VSQQIPAIPAPANIGELVTTLNDRIRRINIALTGGSSSSDSGSAAALKYGKHGARIQTSPSSLPDGSVWIETDRSNVVYQVQAQAWHYAGGTHVATFATRPTGLSTPDTGYQFLASDKYQFYVWSGSAWVEETQANDIQQATGTGFIVLTTSPQIVASLTLNRAGRYLIAAAADLEVLGAGDVGVGLIGEIFAAGTPLGTVETIGGASGTRVTSSSFWFYTAASAGLVVQFEVVKSGGTGSSLCAAGNSTVVVVWIGP
jgi:hypothetical protein